MGSARWTSWAGHDVEEIAIYIGVKEHRPAAADRVIDRIMESVDLLSRHPTMGTSREDLGPGFRLYSVSRYVVVFRAIEDGIEVIRVVDGSRDFTSLFR